MKIEKISRIGVWGYGIVGKAIVRYFNNQGYQIGVMDKRELTQKELLYFHEHNITMYSENEKEQFFIIHDYLFSSPGVNIGENYTTYKHKWLCELDIFYLLFNKPIISVTGSIGKTSTMHLLASLFKLSNKSVSVGGNIGKATFDVLAQQNNTDYALLETSSFQLEYCTQFSPELAVWTNFYPNHLDHHQSEHSYLLAKYNSMKFQTHLQKSLVNLSLRTLIPLPAFNHLRSYFSDTKPTYELLLQLKNNERVYYIENSNVILYDEHKKITPLITLNEQLLNFSFIQNIILLAAVCDLLNLNMLTLYHIPTITQLPEHRLEKIETINSVDFYNDSKSTTTASTLAAVKKLHHRPIHLFLGGLSKGVDRAPFVKQLSQNIKYVYCFGKEANDLHLLCVKNNIPSQKFEDLTMAFNGCITQITNGDLVLFSPSGSSYDLYKNYEERGSHFKDLVKNAKSLVTRKV